MLDKLKELSESEESCTDFMLMKKHTPRWNGGGLHRKKLYKYLHTPAGGTQNQLQNETNYKTKPIAKPDQFKMPML